MFTNMPAEKSGRVGNLPETIAVCFVQIGYSKGEYIGSEMIYIQLIFFLEINSPILAWSHDCIILMWYGLRLVCWRYWHDLWNSGIMEMFLQMDLSVFIYLSHRKL